MPKNLATPVNWPIWVAPVIGLATFLSYLLVFLRWPMTRDVPWVNVLLAILTCVLVGLGLRRAFSRGRGVFSKVVAIPLAGVSLFGVWSFVTAVLMPQPLPASTRAPQVGQPVPTFTLLDTENRPVTLNTLLSEPIDGAPTKGVLLIFEMGHGCHACNSELHDMQRHLDELHAAGIQPVAVSNDTPEVSRALAREAGYTFAFLSDPRREAITKFDLSDPDPNESSRPAEFLVDRTGVVRWRMLTDRMFIRARPQQILAAAKMLE